MVAAANHGRSVVFRVGAPLVLVVMFGALLAWGYTGESAPEPRTRGTVPISSTGPNVQTMPASYHSELPSGKASYSGAFSLKPRAPEGVSLEQARKTAATFLHGPVGAVQVVNTDSGTAIVAIHEERKTGMTRFLVLEKRGRRYRRTSQGPLDADGFRRATWTAETIDADEDGYQEVLFTGKTSNEGRTQRRLVLFVPNDRRTYSMLLTGELTAGNTPRITWLSNATGTDAAAYRTALRQKARELVARKK